MRLFFLEHTVDYERYAFAYRPMLELEAGDALATVYAQGFLPYSGQVEDPRHLFYLARSLRYDLKAFGIDKKRRYAMRKFEAELQPEFSVQSKEAALRQWPGSWRDQVHHWMQERHGTPYLSSARLDYVLAKPYCSHLARVVVGGESFAYLLMSVGPQHAHYWYAFYDSKRIPEQSPGKWLMARAAQWAQASGIPHLYVGTAYATKSAYKCHGVQGVEFFDGCSWNGDLEELRRRQTADLTPSTPPLPDAPTAQPHHDR